MITMEVAAIRKGITPIKNEKGAETGLFFDLTNDAVREVIEDFMDTLTVAERANDARVPASEVRNRIKQRLKSEKEI